MKKWFRCLRLVSGDIGIIIYYESVVYVDNSDYVGSDIRSFYSYDWKEDGYLCV